MRLGTYGILIIFGAFVLLMILNPRLSCFGKRVRSPLYPLLRRRRAKSSTQVKTEDYGFNLVEKPSPQAGPRPSENKKTTAAKKTDDYGFRLD